MRMTGSVTNAAPQTPTTHLHQDLALLRLGGSIQPHVRVAVQVQERLQHVQHLGHLWGPSTRGELRLTRQVQVWVLARLGAIHVRYQRSSMNCV